MGGSLDRTASSASELNEATADSPAKKGNTVGGYVIGSPARSDRFFYKYKGSHASTRTSVFIKLLRTECIGTDSEFGKEFNRVLHRLSSLSHPGLLPVLDSGTFGDQYYVIEPAIDGFALALGLENDHFLDEDKIRIFRQLSDAVEGLHSEGVVYGDLHPNAIFITTDDSVRCGGYGISPLIDSIGQSPARLNEEHRRFCAPEVLAGEHATVRSDVFSLTALFACLLLGKEAWDKSDSHLSQIILVPDVLECLKKGMARSPEDRYASVSEFSTAFFQRYTKHTSVVVPDDPTTRHHVEENEKPGLNKKAALIQGTALFLGAAAILAGVVVVREKKIEEAKRARAEAEPAPIAEPTMPPQFDVPEERPTPTPVPTATPTPTPTPVMATPTPAVPGSTNAWLARVDEWPGHFRIAVGMPGSVPWTYPAIVVFDDLKPATREAVYNLYRSVEGGQLLSGVVRIVDLPQEANSIESDYEITRPEILFIDPSGKVHARMPVTVEGARFSDALKSFVSSSD